MKKIADTYLEPDPWRIVERGFHPEKSRVSESLFCQANEYMGTRAFFEEGYSGDTLPGTYLNGVFEERVLEKSYKSVPNRVRFMVNTVDWTRLSVTVEGERLDLARCAFRDFERSLDFRTGLLSRSFVWVTSGGRELEVRFERLIPMNPVGLAFQRLTVRPTGFSGEAEIEAGLDFSVPHEAYRANFWNCVSRRSTDRGAEIAAKSVATGQRLYAAFELHGERLVRGGYREDEKYVGRRAVLELRDREASVLEKVSAVCAVRDSSMPDDEAFAAVRAASPLGRAGGFDGALVENRRHWDAVWRRSDIVIEGDPENQQGIRFCVFQLEQTYRGRVPGSNIGAKGLTGEFYNGNAFWDTEVYCLPYYLFTNAGAARALLEFRYDTLPQARERARELDCEGACYPVATIDGTESCTLWQHASLQLQPTTAVAYALRHYERVSGDREFLYRYGAEILVETARFLASRVQWSERKQAYGFYCVMGPDEFQMMVNHNAYTNYMGARTLEYAADTVGRMRRERPELMTALEAKLSLQPGEPSRWKEIASKMYIPRDPASLLIEQHEGFFDLPHLDIASIPPEQFPLYHTWAYDRIYRNDMIKQPDVLMLMFLYNRSFGLEEKRANYEYYEPRCIHESSLSPSVHSILASELGLHDEAYRFFRFATRIDLDDYNRNTREGLHMTAVSAAWMNIVYGFGGFRSDGPRPALAPRLPVAWRSLSFRLRYAGSLVSVRITGNSVTLELLDGPPLELELYGEPCRLDAAGCITAAVPKGAAV